MTRIGDHAKSAALIERGRSRMAQCQDYRLDAAKPRLPPVRQTSPLFSWRCAASRCLAETRRVCDEWRWDTSPSACRRHSPAVGSRVRRPQHGHPEAVQSEARPQSSIRRKSSPSCPNGLDAELMADFDLVEPTVSAGYG